MRALEVARAQGVANFEPAYLKLANGGDANATIEITGEASGTLGPLGAVALDVATGNLLASQLPGQRDANHATLSAAYALHFGEFGNGVVVWLYFLLGLGGAFLFYSGNLLWIESRRKRRQPQQPRAGVNMARATVGVCIGLCVAISIAFGTALVLERLAPSAVDHGIRWACFGSWAACALWAALRRPAQAARELLWAAAVSTALVPVLHGALNGDWLWRAAAGALAAVLGRCHRAGDGLRLRASGRGQPTPRPQRRSEQRLGRLSLRRAWPGATGSRLGMGNDVHRSVCIRSVTLRHGPSTTRHPILNRRCAPSARGPAWH